MRIAANFSLRKILLLCLVILACVVLDQVMKRQVHGAMQLYESKTVVDPYLRVTFIFNTGMVFGLRPQAVFPNFPVTTFLTFFMSCAIILMLFYYFFSKDERWFSLTGLSLIIGGALGNLIDRLAFGRVIDYIDMGINESLRWPVYNIADACITIGVGCILLASLLNGKTPLPVSVSTPQNPE